MGKQTVQRVWALLIGAVSITIGLLKFAGFVHISTIDAYIHLVTGVLFICGALVNKGKYTGTINVVLGIVYIIFGVIYVNWPHIIAGAVSVITAAIKPAKNKQHV